MFRESFSLMKHVLISEGRLLCKSKCKGETQPAKTLMLAGEVGKVLANNKREERKKGSK